MMERHELAALAKSMGRMVREFVEPLYANLKSEIGELRVELKAIPAGPAGPQGEPGVKGDTGPTGPQGERGEAGAPGERGDKGEPGERGEKGESGQPGERGPAGLNGERGEKGLDGKDGRDGRDGIAGKDGRDGDPGRDALQIEILPMIDMSKSYPRGTYAKYAGGIARALHNTNPQGPILSDWEIVVDGIASIHIHQGENLREFTVDYGMTSGKRATETFRMPVLIYREIFKEGSEYSRGDVVTFGGSAWHCSAESTKAKPGTSADWRLMVKEGRTGKDGKDGERGPEGPKGHDGKDLTQMGANGQKW